MCLITQEVKITQRGTVSLVAHAIKMRSGAHMAIERNVRRMC